jgi:hypothetical protein
MKNKNQIKNPLTAKTIFTSFIFLICLASVSSISAQGTYKQPPQNVMDVLNSPATPIPSLSPAKDVILLLEPLRYPPVSELAQPMLRLGGLRINPNTNGQHRQPYFVKLTLKNIADGKEMPVSLPAGAQVISPSWSADGKFVAFGNQTPGGIELWVLETASGKAKKLNNVKVNTIFGGGFSWLPDQRSLLVNLVPTKRALAPASSGIPMEPNIQETAGKTGAVQTFQDLLKSPNDEKLFDYYATSQLAVVSTDGRVREIGQPAIFDTAGVSPDGKHILTSRIQHPYSYLYPASRFPKEVEVWDLQGPCIVCDFGTAMTIDAVNEHGEYLGGTIAPGMNVLADALFEKTSKLPKIEIKKPETIIGNSTVQSIQAGIYFGYAGIVDGIVRRMITELGGKPKVVATGGLAAFVAEGCELIETIDETLMLEGLRLIYGKAKLAKQVK